MGVGNAIMVLLDDDDKLILSSFENAEDDNDGCNPTGCCVAVVGIFALYNGSFFIYSYYIHIFVSTNAEIFEAPHVKNNPQSCGVVFGIWKLVHCLETGFSATFGEILLF